MIPIYQPYLPPHSLRYAHEALDSGWISSHGKYLPMLQEKLQDLLGVKHVLLTNNGTSATHLVAKALNFKYPEISNILVPNNVFVAAINSFLFDEGSFRLFSVDADPNTWNVDLHRLKNVFPSWSKVGCLVVHNLGNVIDVPSLQKEHPNWIFVEDNCEGFLGKYQEQYSGTASLASSISFFGNKNLTSGEGGATLTNDTEVYEYLHCLHGQGQSETKFVHHHLGYNYRMTNVQAALLLGQLEIKDEILDRKFHLFERYKNVFRTCEYLEMQIVTSNTQPANWMFGLRYKGSLGYSYLQKYFMTQGIEIRPMFYPLSAHQYLRDRQDKDVFFDQENVALKLQQECFILPSFPQLKLSEQARIIDACIRLPCVNLKEYE